MARRFSEEQKLAAVHRVVIGEESQAAVLREVGCNSSTMSQWVRQYGRQVQRKHLAASEPAPKASSEPATAPPAIERRSNRTGIAPEIKAATLARLRNGEPASALARELNVNTGTIYYWRSNGWRGKSKSGAAPAALTPSRGFVDTSVEASYARLKAAAEEAIICLEKAEKMIHERVYLRLIKEMDDAHVEGMNACRELRRALKKP